MNKAQKISSKNQHRDILGRKVRGSENFITRGLQTDNNLVEQLAQTEETEEDLETPAFIRKRLQS
jgi:hypothetical protein